MLHDELYEHLETIEHNPPADANLYWPFFQSDASQVPKARQQVGCGANHGGVSIARTRRMVRASSTTSRARNATTRTTTNQEVNNGETTNQEVNIDEKAGVPMSELDANEGVMRDDPGELMAVGRSRMKQLPDLQIDDMVAALSSDGVVWFGQLIEFSGGTGLGSGRSTESSSSRDFGSRSSSATVAERKALIHWWDHDRRTPRRTKTMTYHPHWRSTVTDTRKSKRRKGRKRSGASLPQVSYSMRKPGSSWEPVQDWVPASTLLFWCPFGKMFTQRGTLTLRQQRKIELRAESYNLEIKF